MHEVVVLASYDWLVCEVVKRWYYCSTEYHWCNKIQGGAKETAFNHVPFFFFFFFATYSDPAGFQSSICSCAGGFYDYSDWKR